MKKIFISLLPLTLLFTGCSFSKSEPEIIKTVEPSFFESNDEISISEAEADDTVSDSSEIITILNPVMLSELDSELELIEIESTFIEDKLSQDLTTVQMNQAASELFELWDKELNSLWERFWDAADNDLKNKVLAEQREWINEKKLAAKAAGKKYDGGSLQTMVEIKKEASLTRLRCYDLATYLGNIIGQTVTIPIPNIDGFYADTQGTMEAYSDLTIQRASDGFYEIEIGLYRLTTLSGYATLENDVLKFVDESMNLNIKGDIIVEDESATFTITESDWENLNIGDSYYFDEKWD